MDRVLKSLKYFPSDYRIEKIDIIGDVHGCLKKLIKLLEDLGYKKHNNTYYHPERLAVFVGDFIDRGKYIRESLELIYNMIEKQKAIAIMGNHEFNFINMLTYDENNRPLRDYSQEHIRQAKETFRQIPASEYNFWRNKFLELPLLFDFEKIRIVHACWDDVYVEYFDKKTEDLRLTTQQLFDIHKNTDEDFVKAVRSLLKGKELMLTEEVKRKIFKPQYHRFQNEMRIKWWETFENPTWQDIIVKKKLLNEHINFSIPKEFFELYRPYPKDAPPVFFGHYSFEGEIKPLKPNVACVDYGAIYGGYLVAYRWNGEKYLNPKNFLAVK